MLVMLVVSMAYGVLATSVGTGIGLDITPELFAPRIWMCDNRLVMDDAVQSGRGSTAGTNLVERINNYAFEGEQIQWNVLVMDKNKIEEIQEVVGTIGAVQGVGNDIEVECVNTFRTNVTIPASCNARLGEEVLTLFDDQTMGYYQCTLTVETPDSMYGEYFITVEAISVDGEATMDENEYWFLNPIIALSVDGDLEFMDVLMGSVAYSSTLLIGNDADDGSGVLLDMFISGTDFYDPASSGARCPTTNHLKLSQNIRESAQLGAGILAGAQASGNQLTDDCDIDQWINDPLGVEQGVDNHDHLCYFATSGAYSSASDPRADAEGYAPIVYSDAFSTDFYNDAEIIMNDGNGDGDAVDAVDHNLAIGALDAYFAGNVLSPGSEIAITFKLGLPEPCVGDFSEGDIYFWGEAI